MHAHDRPPLRRTDVTTTLIDFAIVTFCVAPETLRALLPSGIEPELFTLRDGRSVALVSAVPFQDRDFRFTCAPWLRASFGQINYRAYVVAHGKRAVWFFGTSLTSPLVAIPHYLWRMPWHGAHMQFETAWTDGRCKSYSLHARSAWANAELSLTGTDQACGTLDGFADDEATRIILTHPLQGYYRRSDGRIGSYNVWHEALRMQRAVPHVARFDLFERLGLISATDTPHSALVQRSTEFIVRLPPARG